MVKKNERQAIRPDTCSKCKRGKPVKVSKGGKTKCVKTY